MGAAVTSVSRSGRPRNLTGAWLDSVEWVQVRVAMHLHVMVPAVARLRS